MTVEHETECVQTLVYGQPFQADGFRIDRFAGCRAESIGQPGVVEQFLSFLFVSIHRHIAVAFRRVAHVPETVCVLNPLWIYVSIEHMLGAELFF